MTTVDEALAALRERKASVVHLADEQGNLGQEAIRLILLGTAPPEEVTEAAAEYVDRFFSYLQDAGVMDIETFYFKVIGIWIEGFVTGAIYTTRRQEEDRAR